MSATAACADLAPQGILRASINLGNPLLARRDGSSGEVFGVSVDLARALAERLGVPIIFADETWNITHWLRAVAGRDEPPARCAYCCESRMEAAFAFARQQGFAWVSSSLLYSRYQPHEIIKSAGERLAAQPDAPGFAYRDFRADWQEGIDRSKAMQLYRQPYCGCVYSEAERYHKQLVRCING